MIRVYSLYWNIMWFLMTNLIRLDKSSCTFWMERNCNNCIRDIRKNVNGSFNVVCVTFGIFFFLISGFFFKLISYLTIREKISLNNINFSLFFYIIEIYHFNVIALKKEKNSLFMKCYILVWLSCHLKLEFAKNKAIKNCISEFKFFLTGKCLSVFSK